MLGYITAFALPLLGLLLGIVCVTRPDKATARHGRWIIGDQPHRLGHLGARVRLGRADFDVQRHGVLAPAGASGAPWGVEVRARGVELLADAGGSRTPLNKDQEDVDDRQARQARPPAHPRDQAAGPWPRRRSTSPPTPQISERAYFIALEQGSADELGNWLRAERELAAA